MLSEDALNSEFVNLEARYAAVHGVVKHTDAFLLPVLIKACNPPTWLAEKQHYDYTGHPEKAFEGLLARIKAASGEIRVSVAIVDGHSEIFQGAINFLHSEDRWGMVEIFAPVGLWQDLEDKRKWFRELAGYLDQKKLDNFRAIYGFPNEGMIKPTDINLKTGKLRRDPANKKIEQAHRLLRLAATSIKIFEDTPNTVIRYIPPVEVSIGFGAIIFEAISPPRRDIFLGFSTGADEWIVDKVLALANAHELLAHYLSDWVMNTLMGKSTKSFVLKDTHLPEKIEMATQWDKELMKYYHPKVRLKWRDIPDK